MSRRVSSLTTSVPESCVVLDIGSRTVRAGMSGEHLARCTLRLRDTKVVRKAAIPNDALQTLTVEYLGELEDRLDFCLREAINRYLYLSPKGKRVVLVESHYLPIKIKRIMARVLFTYHLPREIAFMPASICCTIALGVAAGIIVDIGTSECSIVPVFDQRPLNSLVRTTRSAGIAMFARTRYLLGAFSEPPVGNSIETADVEHFLGIAPVCLPMSPLLPDVSDAVPDEDLHSHYDTTEYRGKRFSWTLPSTGNVVSLPQWVRFAIPEVLFETRGKYVDPAYASIPSCVAALLRATAIDTRANLKHLIVTGGLCQMPGLEARLGRETGLTILKNVHGQQLAWTGASLASSLGITGQVVTIQQFNSTSRVPDWSTQLGR